MKASIRRLLYFSLGTVAGAGVSFITIPVTTYFVDPSEFGKASLFILIQTLMTGYLYFGFDQAYVREYYESDDRKNLLQNAMFIPLLIAIGFSGCFLIFHKTIAFYLFYDQNLIFPILLLCISMFTLIFERFFLLSIRMEERAKLYSLLTFLIKLFILGMTLCFILLGKRDFSVIIYGTLIGQILGDILVIGLCIKFFNVAKFKLDKALIKKLGVYGFPIFIAFSVDALFNASDRFLLRSFSNFTELGLYTAAFKIASLLKIIQSSFTSFWLPVAYRWHASGRKIADFQWIADVVTGGFACVFMLILLCKPIILWIFTNGYNEVIDIFPFLCFVPILYTISETTTLGIVFSRKSYLNIYVSIGAVLTNIGLACLLIPILGAKGAAISVGVAYFVYYMLRTLISNRQWEGLAIQKQLLTIAILFIAGFYNTFFTEYHVLVSILLLLLVIGIHFQSFQKLLFQKRGENA